MLGRLIVPISLRLASPPIDNIAMFRDASDFVRMLCDGTDVDDEDDDPYLAYRNLVPQRWAPAAIKGSRWDQRDSPAAAWVAKLIADQVTLDLDDDVALSPIRVKSRLGEGRFGDVLLGEAANGRRVAIKVALRATSELEREAEVLRLLSSAKRGSFPTLWHHQRTRAGGGPCGSSASELLVMQLLGPSLQEQVGRRERLAAPALLHVGRCALRCLHDLHDAGFVHNDVKPANLLRGTAGSAQSVTISDNKWPSEANLLRGTAGSARADEVHLIDFGLATRWQARPGADGSDEECGGAAAKASTSARRALGSRQFASLRAHEGHELPRPVDDLESLAYVLVLLGAGRLPWDQEQYARYPVLKRRALRCGSGNDLVDGWADDCKAVEAVRALWAEVVACQGGQGRVNYEACLEAFEVDS